MTLESNVLMKEHVFLLPFIFYDVIESVILLNNTVASNYDSKGTILVNKCIKFGACTPLSWMYCLIAL
jgi:hypothetical protein